MKKINPMHRQGAILLLAAGIAGQAMAQNNVTLYGYIDTGIVKESGTTAKLDRGLNNWLGFKGTEDLGDGLSAVFNIQMRFKPDTGEAEKPTLFQGETTVGLASHSLGKLRIGRALTPFWAAKWAFEPWWDSQFMGSIGAYQNGSYSSDPTNALGFANFSRIPNGVFYDSPTLGGVQVRVATEMEKAVGATARTRSVAANYNNGPLAATMSYEKNNLKDDILFLGASYQLSALTLMGGYGKVQLHGAPNSEKNYTLAAAYALGVDTVRAGYGRINDVGGTTLGTSQHKIAVGYNHALSKRTNLYADLYREKTATSLNGVALGINHSF
jgi:predicted porin